MAMLSLIIYGKLFFYLGLFYRFIFKNLFCVFLGVIPSPVMNQTRWQTLTSSFYLIPFPVPLSTAATTVTKCTVATSCYATLLANGSSLVTSHQTAERKRVKTYQLFSMRRPKFKLSHSAQKLSIFVTKAIHCEEQPCWNVAWMENGSPQGALNVLK